MRELRKIILACCLALNKLVNELSGILYSKYLELISILTFDRKTTRYFVSRCLQKPSQLTCNIGLVTAKKSHIFVNAGMLEFA